MNKYLTTLLIALVATGLMNQRAVAFIPLPSGDGQIKYDPENTSFDDLRPITREGSFDAEPELIRLIGYDPSRSWAAGASPADVLKLGDIQVYGLQKLSLTQIAERQGLQLKANELPLDQIGYLEGMTLKELTVAMPGLGSKRIGNVPVLRKIFNNQYNDLTVDQILNNNSTTLNLLSKKASFQEVELQVQAQLDKYQLDLNEQQEIILDDLSSSLNNYVKAEESQIATAAQDAISGAKAQYEAQLEQFQAEAQAAVQAEIQDFLKSNLGLDQIQVNTFIQNRLNQYQTDLDTKIGKELAAYKDNVIGKLEVGGINLGELTGLDAVLNNYIDQVDDIVSDYLDQAKNKAIEAISSLVKDKIGDLAGSFTSSLLELGDLQLSDYDLSKFFAADLPGVEKTAIERFKGYKNESLSEIPNAKSLPLSQFPSLPPLPQAIGTVDLVFSDAEKYTIKTISGGGADLLVPKDCSSGNDLGNGCSHIEVNGLLGDGLRWVSGDSQKVSGGKNLLKNYGGGKEPTGRTPFAKAPFKMVLRNNDELTDSTEMSLSFRFCFTDFFGTEHCTPYNVFEVPFYTYQVRDFIYLGI
jgi:hypothetical protein